MCHEIIGEITVLKIAKYELSFMDIKLGLSCYPAVGLLCRSSDFLWLFCDWR